MASKVAQKRLSKEYAALARSPPPFVYARADESNILECHFIMRGPDDSPYAGGEYWGVVGFPSEYPFKPPGIRMMTPSGRFQPDRKICTSMSDYHPGTWNPAWSVATILTGLLSFLLSDEITTGSVRTTDEVKKAFARKSHDFNRNNARFRAIFPEYSGETMKSLPNMGESERGSTGDTPDISARPSYNDIANEVPQDTSTSEKFSSASFSKATPGTPPTLNTTTDQTLPVNKNNDTLPPAPARIRNMPWYLYAGMAVLFSVLILKITG